MSKNWDWKSPTKIEVNCSAEIDSFDNAEELIVSIEIFAKDNGLELTDIDVTVGDYENINLYAHRMENDAEFQTRQDQIAAQIERAAQRKADKENLKANKESEELKTYKRLHKKYGNT